MKQLSTIVIGCAILFCATSCQKESAPPEAQSPYISAVYDYSPAPGQFVNTMPVLSAEMSKTDVVLAASKALCGVKAGELVTLGGFGGSIVFGFDHTVENRQGLRDFRIMGNAFNNSPDPSLPGGSAEPGVIYVSYDQNNNNQPDDKWYEIAGSEYKNSASLPDYQISYHRPSSELPSQTYIKWDDNQNQSGFLAKSQLHNQSYFPHTASSQQTITFKGVLLPPNGVDISSNGSLWVMKAYGHGYADNAPNNHPDSAIDIGWAVNDDGSPANLKGINFVKIVSAINQQCGPLGEVSTEVCGAYDLHLLGEKVVSQ